MLHDLNEKLEQELKNKDDQFALRDEKIKAISEKLDISEQKLLEFASMPDIEEQLKDRMEALTQAQERQACYPYSPFLVNYDTNSQLLAHRRARQRRGSRGWKVNWRRSRRRR